MKYWQCLWLYPYCKQKTTDVLCITLVLCQVNAIIVITTITVYTDVLFKEGLLAHSNKYRHSDNNNPHKVPSNSCQSCRSTCCSHLEICASLSLYGRQTVWWEQVIIICQAQRTVKPPVLASLCVGGMLGRDTFKSSLLCIPSAGKPKEFVCSP